MSQQRTSMAPPPNSNLYCASCDSQIGIFENEWTHLTSSYARSQEKGTHFGTEIGVKTQAVPEGSAQKNAEGCEMSEVYCTQCSTVVAQYCRTAPEPSQKAFVGQHFYKISRVYLKDSHTSASVEMHFIDGEGDSSQKSRNSVASSTVPRQKLPPPRAASDVPFRQSFPPPSNQTWQRPHSQSYLPKQSISNDFRSASAQPMLDFRADQFASITECANRITANDMRLANQEMRFNTSQERVQNLETRVNNHEIRLGRIDGNVESVEMRLEDLKGEYQNLESYVHDQDDKMDTQREKLVVLEDDMDQLESKFRDQGNIIKEQQRRIEEQNQELRRATAKLDELQSIMDGLKATVDQSKSQSSPVTLSKTKSNHQYLGDLQVTVQTAESIGADTAVIQALWDENNAMKARLKTVAAAIGFAADNDVNSMVEDNAVLGKRKRGVDPVSVQQQKVSRTSRMDRLEPTQSVLQLSTPDSNQNRTSSLQDTQNKANVDAEARMGDLDTDPDSPVPPECLDDHVMHLSDDVMPEDTVASSIEMRTETENSTIDHQERRSRAHNEANDVPSKTANVTITRAVESSVTASWQSVRPVRNIGEQVLPDKAVRPRISLPTMTTLLGSNTLRNASVSFTSKGPVSMIERMRSPSVRGSPAPSRFSGLSSLPPSHNIAVKDASTSLRQETFPTSGLQKVETFSGALSRGETLENVVQRSQTPNAKSAEIPLNGKAAPPAEEAHRHNFSAVNSQILQPSQASRLNTLSIAASASDNMDVSDAVSPDESADLSDVENEMPSKQNNESRPTAMNTPMGEPKLGPTLISRTVPGLTFEPLIRPIIVDDSDSGNHTGSRRSSSLNLSVPNALPIMPEIMAAIKNLNECVVVQSASPASSMPAPRATRSKAPTSGSKTARKDLINSKESTTQLSENDHSLPSATVIGSKSSGKSSTDQNEAPAVEAAVQDTAKDRSSSNRNSSHIVHTLHTLAKSGSSRPTESAETQGAYGEQVKEPNPERCHGTRKSLSRQELLVERNRLAMEAMAREEVGKNFYEVAV